MDEMSYEDFVEPLVVLGTAMNTHELWRAVAAGEISAEDAAERLRGEEPHELIEASVTQFVPPSPEQLERRLHALLELASPPLWRRWLLGGGLALAAAIALTLGLLLGGEPSLTPVVGYAPPEFRQQYEQIRDAASSDEVSSEAASPAAANSEARVPEYLEDQTLEIWLSPDTAFSEALDVVVYGRHEGGAPVELPLRPQVRDNGVVHVEVGVREAGLTPGRWVLLFVIGHAGALPDDLERRLMAPHPTEGSSRVVEGRVDIVEREHR